MIIVKLIESNIEYADYKYTKTRDGKGWGLFRIWLDGSKYEMLEPHYPKDPKQCYLYLENIASRIHLSADNVGHSTESL